MVYVRLSIPIQSSKIPCNANAKLVSEGQKERLLAGFLHKTGASDEKYGLRYITLPMGISIRHNDNDTDKIRSVSTYVVSVYYIRC